MKVHRNPSISELHFHPYKGWTKRRPSSCCSRKLRSRVSQRKIWIQIPDKVLCIKITARGKGSTSKSRRGTKLVQFPLLLGDDLQKKSQHSKTEKRIKGKKHENLNEQEIKKEKEKKPLKLAKFEGSVNIFKLFFKNKQIWVHISIFNAFFFLTSF